MKKISVIAPCYNEKDYIQGFIEDLRKQDYPFHLLEFIIADGDSNDGTPDLIKNLTNNDPRFIILRNEMRTAPFALNMAIRKASGDIIIRMDVHASYPSSYIRVLSDKLLSDPKIGNTGAVLITSPSNDDKRSMGIACAMSSPLGVGSAKFRTGITKDTFVDTVPFGCYHKKLFEEIGYFNEKLTRAQDYEFNTRITLAGYKILLTPEVKLTYYARNTFSNLSQMYLQYASSKVFSNKTMGCFGNFRQFVPPVFYTLLAVLYIVSIFQHDVFPLALGITFGYLITLMVLIFQKMVIEKRISVAPYMFFAVICMHASYAYGYLKGIYLYLILNKQGLAKNLKITR